MINFEKQLLLLLSLPELQKPQLKKINLLLQKKINWNYLFSLSKRHQVSGMVYYNLNKYSLRKSKYLQNFKKLYEKNIYTNLIFLSEAKLIFSLFNQEKIFFTPLKGIYFLQNIYASMGCRQLSDIDILVKKNDLKKIVNIFQKLNYSQLRHKTKNHLIFKNRRNALVFEIHFELANPQLPGELIFFPFKRKIIMNSHPEIFMKMPIKPINKEVMLIYLCFHLLKEYYQSYKWWADLQGFLNKYSEQINYQKLLFLLNKFKLKKMVTASFIFICKETKFSNNLISLITKSPLEKKNYLKIRSLFYGEKINIYKKFEIYYLVTQDHSQKILLIKNTLGYLLNIYNF